MALLSYEAASGMFPPGGLPPAQGTPQGPFGFSWWVRILPYIDQGVIYQKLSQSQGGWLGQGGDNNPVLFNQRFAFMYCPSSTLPPLALNDAAYLAANGMTPANVQSPTYCGISGAITASSTSTMQDPYYSDPLAPGTTGTICADGVFIEYSGVTTAQIRDGLTNTMAVGEQSDWLGPPLYAAGWGNDTCDVGNCRADCAQGFSMGPAPQGGDQRAFNLTCVSQPINAKSTLAYGVFGNCGPNSPIQSVHPAGANVLMADGSVHFLNQALDFTILCNLANRDDGNAIPPM